MIGIEPCRNIELAVISVLWPMGRPWGEIRGMTICRGRIPLTSYCRLYRVCGSFRGDSPVLADENTSPQRICGLGAVVAMFRIASAASLDDVMRGCTE